MRRALPRHRVALLCLLLAVAGACGGGDDEPTAEAVRYAAQVASYELVVGQSQRLMAGLAVQGTGEVISFGSVRFELFYLGTADSPVDPPQPRGDTTAAFLPVPGRALPAGEDEPRRVRPSEGLGVYEAVDVTFDEPGTWGLRVSATVDGEAVTANTNFPVRATPRVPAPGMQAPRTENATVASVGATAAALDSRADADTPVPDPELHETSVAAALAAGRPVVVVVSTPVYCVSQFCGPITDRVHALAQRYRDRAAFVHLEVWEDFEARRVNPAAREWVQPGGVGDLQEPWVFFVGADGIVRERFDNVASDKQLEDAVRRLVGTAP